MSCIPECLSIQTIYKSNEHGIAIICIFCWRYRVLHEYNIISMCNTVLHVIKYLNVYFARLFNNFNVFFYLFDNANIEMDFPKIVEYLLWRMQALTRICANQSSTERHQPFWTTSSSFEETYGGTTAVLPLLSTPIAKDHRNNAPIIFFTKWSYRSILIQILFS